MRFISPRMHGMLDYPVGILMLLAPVLWGVHDAPRTILMVVGIAILLMSTLTDYPMGIVRRIGFATHVGIDVFVGALLVVSPWIFGFGNDDAARNVFVTFGIIVLLTSLMSHTVSVDERDLRHRPA